MKSKELMIAEVGKALAKQVYTAYLYGFNDPWVAVDTHASAKVIAMFYDIPEETDNIMEQLGEISHEEFMELRRE